MNDDASVHSQPPSPKDIPPQSSPPLPLNQTDLMVKSSQVNFKYKPFLAVLLGPAGSTLPSRSVAPLASISGLRPH